MGLGKGREGQRTGVLLGSGRGATRAVSAQEKPRVHVTRHLEQAQGRRRSLPHYRGLVHVPWMPSCKARPGQARLGWARLGLRLDKTRPGLAQLSPLP